MRKQLLFINLTVWAFLLLNSTPLPAFSQAQTYTIYKITNFPSRFFEKLQKSSAEMEESFIERSSKALKKPARQESLQGLQTRTDVQGLIQQQLSASGPNCTIIKLVAAYQKLLKYKIALYENKNTHSCMFFDNPSLYFFSA